MSGRSIPDRGSQPDLPLRDHRPDVDPEARNVPHGLQIEKREAGWPFRYVAEGHVGSQGTQPTVGDLQGGQFVPPATRAIGSWTFALPVVISEDEEIPPSLALAGSRARAREQEPSRERVVRYVPVRTGPDFGGDPRYAPGQAFAHPDSPRVRKGTPGVVLVSTEEKKQVNLFLPTDPGVLIAVNRRGDPEKSTLVYDLDDNGGLDPQPAPLHTAWRVLVPDKRCAVPTDGPALAWQLGVSGQDAKSGHGWVTAGAGSELVDPEPERRPEPPGEPEDPTRTRTRDPGANGTRARPQQPGVGQPTSVERPPGPPPAFAPPRASSYSAKIQGTLDAIDQLQQRRAGIQAQIQRVKSDLARSGVPFGAGAVNRLVAQIRQIDGEIARLRSTLSDTQTRTRDGGGDSTTADPGGGGERTPGNVHALMGSLAGGPLEVGGLVDQHQVGTDRDGHPINAGHLHTSTLFRGGAGDAPLEFEPTAYSQPDGYPLRSPVHLRNDPESAHQWRCGVGAGLWRWEAEVPAIPSEPELPPPPLQPPPLPNLGPFANAGRPGMGGAGGPGTGPGGVGARGGRGGRPRLSGDPPVARAGLGGSVAGRFARASAPGPRGGVPRGAPFRGAEQSSGLPAGSLGIGGVGRGVSAWQVAALRAAGVLDQTGWPTAVWVRTGEQGTSLRGKLGGRDTRAPLFPGQVVAAGGIAIKARPDNAVAEDFARGGNASSARRLGTYRSAPTAMVLEGHARGDGTWRGWRYGAGGRAAVRTGSPAPEGGGVLPLPAGVELRHVLDGDYNPANPLRVSPYVMDWIMAGGLTRLVFSTPDRQNGARGGVAMKHAPTGLQFIPLDSGDGSELVSPLMTFGESGLLVVGNADVTGKLTVGGLIDPTGLVLAEQAADPMAGADVGLFAGDTAGANEAWWRRDDGTLVDLSAGGSLRAQGSAISGFAPQRVDRTGILAAQVNLLPRMGARESACIGLNGTLIEANGRLSANTTAAGAGGADYLTLSGTVTTAISTAITGVGTSFLAELDAVAHALSGTVTSAGFVVTGSGTDFTREIAVGDLIGSSAHGRFVYVTAITQDNLLTTSLALGAAGATAVKRVENATVTIDRGGGNFDSETISHVTSATAMVLRDLTANGAAGLGIELGGLPSGNVIDTIHTYAWVVSGTGGVAAMISSQRTRLLNPPATHAADSRRVGVAGVLEGINQASKSYSCRCQGTTRTYQYRETDGSLALVSAFVAGVWTAIANIFSPPTASQLHLGVRVIGNSGAISSMSVRPRNMQGASALQHPITAYSGAATDSDGQVITYLHTQGTDQGIEGRATGAFGGGGGGRVDVVGFVEEV